MQMYISNTMPYGYMMAPLEHESKLEEDKNQLTNVLVMILHETGEIIMKESMSDYLPRIRK